MKLAEPIVAEMSPQEYLQHLQLSAVLERGWFVRLESEEARDAAHRFIGTLREHGSPLVPQDASAQVDSMIDKAYGRPRPPFEQPLLAAMLEDFARQIVAAATQFDLTLRQEVVVGTLHTGRVNAVAIKVPSGGEIVAVNHGTFIFIYLAAKAVSSFLPLKPDGGFSTAKEDLEHTLRTNREGHARFADALVSYLIEGDPSAAQPYVQPEKQSRLAYLLSHTAEIFVLAHEFAHVFHGHLVVQSNLVSLPGGREDALVQYEEIRRSWQEELEADHLGAMLTLQGQLNQGLDLALSYAGIDFVLTCFHIVEEALGGEVSETHPPALLRRELLRRRLREDYGEAGAAAAVDLAERLEGILGACWGRTKPFLEHVLAQQAPAVTL